MITRFKCDVCKETKIEIWVGQSNTADYGREKGSFACKECREKFIGSNENRNENA